MPKESRETLKKRLLEALPEKQIDAVQGKDLAVSLGITYRQLKALIQELRIEYPICSREWGGGGYWIAEDDNDIKSFIGMIKAHRATYDITIEVMKNHLGGGI